MCTIKNYQKYYGYYCRNTFSSIQGLCSWSLRAMESQGRTLNPVKRILKSKLSIVNCQHLDGKLNLKENKSNVLHKNDQMVLIGG